MAGATTIREERIMPRKRPVMPSVADLLRPPRVSTAYDAALLGASKATEGSMALTQAEQRNPQLREAMEAAKNGDDSLLMPYQPTPSINPPRPRTLAAGYDKINETMYVRFRDGAVYAYEGVRPSEWRNYKRVKSPGRSINRTFNFKNYYRIDMTE